MTPSLKWNEASASAVKNRLESAYHDLRVPSYYLGYAAAFGAVAGPQFSDAYDRLLIYIEALQKGYLDCAEHIDRVSKNLDAQDQELRRIIRTYNDQPYDFTTDNSGSYGPGHLYR